MSSSSSDSSSSSSLSKSELKRKLKKMEKKLSKLQKEEKTPIMQTISNPTSAREIMRFQQMMSKKMQIQSAGNVTTIKNSHLRRLIDLLLQGLNEITQESSFYIPLSALSLLSEFSKHDGFSKMDREVVDMIFKRFLARVQMLGH
jgi:hypothetical protein